MLDDRKMICDTCRKAAPISDIKYILDPGNRRKAICTSCRSKTMQKPSVKPVQSVQKKEYYCSRCNYKFKFNPKGLSNLACPYCGKADKVEENKSRMAEEYLNLADDSMSFYSLGSKKRL